MSGLVADPGDILSDPAVAGVLDESDHRLVAEFFSQSPTRPQPVLPPPPPPHASSPLHSLGSDSSGRKQHHAFNRGFGTASPNHPTAQHLHRSMGTPPRPSFPEQKPIHLTMGMMQGQGQGHGQEEGQHVIAPTPVQHFGVSPGGQSRILNPHHSHPHPQQHHHHAHQGTSPPPGTPGHVPGCHNGNQGVHTPTLSTPSQQNASSADRSLHGSGGGMRTAQDAANLALSATYGMDVQHSENHVGGVSGANSVYGQSLGQLLEGATPEMKQKLLQNMGGLEALQKMSPAGLNSLHSQLVGLQQQAASRDRFQGMDPAKAASEQAAMWSAYQQAAQQSQVSAVVGGLGHPKPSQPMDLSGGNLILAAPSVVPRQGAPNGGEKGGQGLAQSSSEMLMQGISHSGMAGTSAVVQDTNGVAQENTPSRRSSVPDNKTYAALSAALDTLTASLNEDGTLPLSTFEKIVQELSGIECLQSMLLFRPNKKKGKGGRQPAKDPRLDPNIDPRKAKRIVANRQSAARSKQKQKQHLESLQLQHDTLTIQILLCRREKEKLEKENGALTKDTKVLELEIQALTDHMTRVDAFIHSLLQEHDRLRIQMRMMTAAAMIH